MSESEPVGSRSDRGEAVTTTAIMTQTERLNGHDATAPVPQQETLTKTRRQRLFHVIKLNAARFDFFLVPVTTSIEELPVGERAALRILFSLAQKTFKIDLQQHPHAILLLFLHLLDDRSFNSIWDSLAPLLEWCAKGE